MEDFSYFDEFLEGISPSARKKISSAKEYIKNNWAYGRATSSKDIRSKFNNSIRNPHRNKGLSLVRILKHELPYFCEQLMALLGKPYYIHELHFKIKNSVDGYPSRKNSGVSREDMISSLNNTGDLPYRRVLFFPSEASLEVYNPNTLKKLARVIDLEALAYMSKIESQKIKELID